MDQFPNEVVAVLGGVALYFLFYFFGIRRQPPLRKTRPNLLFGLGIAALGFGVLIAAIIFSKRLNTPLRVLTFKDDAYDFVRDAYWFSIPLLTTGLCEVIRAIVHPPKPSGPIHFNRRTQRFWRKWM